MLTIRVRLQRGTHSSIAETVSHTLKYEGASAFYKGASAPLIGIGGCVSIQFYAFHEAKRAISEKLNGGLPLTFGQYYLAGAAAGVANTVASAPVEHVRILMQAQEASKGRYHGAFDAAKQIWKSYGFRGLYRGTAVTTLREFQSYGVWFLVFEYLISRDTSQGVQRGDIPAWKLMLNGAIAGEALWLSAYPLDVIKSVVQSDGFGKDARYSGGWDATKRIWISRGFGGFWRGLTPTLIRACPVSAATFLSVELTLRALQ